MCGSVFEKRESEKEAADEFKARGLAEKRGGERHGMLENMRAQQLGTEKEWSLRGVSKRERECVCVCV